VKDLFRKHYYFSDDDVIDVVLSVVAGNHLDSDPVWLHLIGPPSSGKTELLYSVFTCPETYFLSDLTPSSLISGYKDPPKEGAPKKRTPKKAKKKGKAKVEDEQKAEDKAEEEAEEKAPALIPEEKDYSLLPKLNGKVVVTKDFSILHDKPAETRAQVLAILRDVYDGYASRALGNSETKGYFSRFNYLTGMTPDIEKCWSLNTLGERFLMYRIRIKDPREHARRALLNARDRDKGTSTVRSEVQTAVKEFLAAVERTKPEVGDDMVEKILDLAALLSTCRTYVHRGRNGELTCLPQAELASRVGKQLLRLGQGLALVRGRREVGGEEFEVLKRIALDSLPTNRRVLLVALWRVQVGPKQAQPLEYFASRVSRLSEKTVRRELDNLVELGAVERETRQVPGQLRGQKTNKTFYQLAEQFRRGGANVGGLAPP
jgi:hypothetical protein